MHNYASECIIMHSFNGEWSHQQELMASIADIIHHRFAGRCKEISYGDHEVDFAECEVVAREILFLLEDSGFLGIGTAADGEGA